MALKAHRCALEQQLVGLLLEYEVLRTAWPKGRHVLDRAKIGRQGERTLNRIHELEKAIASAQAQDLAEAAVQLRRALAALEAMTAWRWALIARG